MKKVYIQRANENWIVDWMCDDFTKHVMHRFDLKVVNSYVDADVIWLLADWCWNQIPHAILASKFVVTTVHHIVPETFTGQTFQDFKLRDNVTDVYHVFSQRSKEFLQQHTSKPIEVIKYWVSGRFPALFSSTGSKINPAELSKLEARKFLQGYTHQAGQMLPEDAFVIGSFQRDTLGNSIGTGEFLPKLEKGPDIFCDYIERVAATTPNLHVLLAGWRRQYVINRLNAANIPFTFIELRGHGIMQPMYRALDLYVVSSRCEGGPQALLEAGYFNVPTITTPVGIAEQVLPPTSIAKACDADALLQVTATVPDVKSMLLSNLDSTYFPKVLRPYVELLTSANR